MGESELKVLWSYNPAGIVQEVCCSFHKSKTVGWNEYLAIDHFSVDGQLEFKPEPFHSIPKE